MGVVEDVGLGFGKLFLVVDEDGEMGDEVISDSMVQYVGIVLIGLDIGEIEYEVIKLVNCVRVDKEVVRRYVVIYGISLERMCDVEGFVEGYVVKQIFEEDGEEDVEME